MALKPGLRLGPYQVVSLLGSGGMGEVYRARDPRLDRDVAIKVVPDEIAGHDHLRRFEQEARAAGALNHPNVLAVYDIGTHDGAPYIVSELLEGQTLRDRLAGAALPVRKTMDQALQIAHGLAAAHDTGIVHRDLKPENVFVTNDGQVKLLDFGLAKLARPMSLPQDDGRSATRATEPGTVLGTVGYMSPEQVRGEATDHRSDIFSFGAVLYEMLSGRRAFRRESAVETMNAILNEDPPELSGASRSIPPPLERIVHRCLEKRREDRFHSAHDLALAFEAFSSGASRSFWGAAGRGRRLAGVGAVVALVALVAVMGLWIDWPREPTRPPLEVRPITSDPGIERDPALSPDGNQVAFVKARDLYVKLIDGGEPLLVSQGAMDTFPGAPAWSPDGRRIAFLRRVKEQDGRGVDAVVVVPALGGTARQLATLHGNIRHGLSWSPDQKVLAVAHRESAEEPTGIVLLSLESDERRRLTRPPAGYVGDSMPRFSPDGRSLAFVRSVAAFQTDVYLASVDGEEERRLTIGNLATPGLDWAGDGESIVFSSWRPGGPAVVSLWRVPVAGGEPEPLAFGERGEWPTISPRSGRLAYAQREGSMDIWRVGGPKASAGERSPTRLISSTRRDYHAGYSPDGQQIAFASLRSGAGEIWICDDDGSNPRQLTFLTDSVNLSPIWSPDGRQIAFTSAKEGAWNVYVVSISGGVPRPLTRGLRSLGSSWSRDGRWVYFHSNRSGRFEMWKVSPQGGDAIQVTTRGGTSLRESLDGRFLYYGKQLLGENRPGIWRIPSDGGEEVKILDRGGSAWWTVHEQSVLHLNGGAAPPALELLDLASGKVSWAAPLEVPVTAPVLSVSPDGRWVLYTGAERSEADIMLVEYFE